MWGWVITPSATISASKLVSTQHSTARESAPKRPRARLMAEPVSTSSPSSRMVSWMASTIPEATWAERSAPVTGRPRAIQAITASSTRPIRSRSRRLSTKEP